MTVPRFPGHASPAVRLISVIVVEFNRGQGIPGDPVRRVFAYHDPETGNLLAENDVLGGPVEITEGPLAKEPRDPGHRGY